MNDEQLLRYSRHILLKGFDYEKQTILASTKFLIVGAGGLGCPAALYLAASGAGQITLADGDTIELGNLQRQIAYEEADIGKNKAVVLAEKLLKVNSDIYVNIIDRALSDTDLLDACSEVNIVIDCSDNFKTRFALNQACWKLRTPLISGAAINTEGQLLVIDPRQRDCPCYQCLVNESLLESKMSCAITGVLSPIVGVIGSWQAVEAIKVATKFGKYGSGMFLHLDALNFRVRKLSLSPDPDCKVCSMGRYSSEVIA